MHILTVYASAHGSTAEVGRFIADVLQARGIEADILPVCRELGIAITAYGVLSRGLISGHFIKLKWFLKGIGYNLSHSSKSPV